jgi:hypothetical protein
MTSPPATENKTDVADLDLAPASALFHLKPCSVGTSDVEALTGYIERLAKEHNVFVSTLATKEVLPLLKPSATYSNRTGAYDQLTGQWWKDCSVALSGLSPSAQEWAEAIGELTLRPELRFLTMLTWRSVLSVRGLLRRRLAWCPECFEEMRVQRSTVYRPLLWAAKLVSVCVRHRRPLQEKCPFPDCGCTLSVLSPHSLAGFCPHCNRWLGQKGDGVCADEPETDLWRSQVQAAVWVGEMLAVAPSLQTIPRRESISLAAMCALEMRAGGNVTELARQLGMDKHTALKLLDGSQLPQLGTVMKLCGLLETTPLRLLTETIDANEPVQCAPVIVPGYSIGSMRKFDDVHIRGKLREALDNPSVPPPPLATAASQLGYDQSFLSGKLPELCGAIRSRYLAFRQTQKEARIRRLCLKARQEVLSLHAQGIFPSKHRLARTLHRALMTESAVFAAYENAMREIGYESK